MKQHEGKKYWSKWIPTSLSVFIVWFSLFIFLYFVNASNIRDRWWSSCNDGKRLTMLESENGFRDALKTAMFYTNQFGIQSGNMTSSSARSTFSCDVGHWSKFNLVLRCRKKWICDGDNRMFYHEIMSGWMLILSTVAFTLYLLTVCHVQEKFLSSYSMIHILLQYKRN